MTTPTPGTYPPAPGPDVTVRLDVETDACERALRAIVALADRADARRKDIR